MCLWTQLWGLLSCTKPHQGLDEGKNCTPALQKHSLAPMGATKHSRSIQALCGLFYWRKLWRSYLYSIWSIYPALTSSRDTGSTLRVFTGRITEKQLFCSSLLSAIPQCRQVPKTKLLVTTDKCHTQVQFDLLNLPAPHQTHPHSCLTILPKMLPSASQY